MSIFLRVVGLGFAILLAGCAASYQSVKASYDQARPCCATLSDLKYQKLSDQGPTLVEIDETSQVFQFDTGKSYVAAFVLPARAAPYTLSLKSFTLGDHIDSSHIFYPQVLILDAQHQALAQHQLNGLRATSATFFETVDAKSWGLMIKLDAAVVIDPAAARYAVIYTTTQLLALSSPYLTMRGAPVILFGIMTVLPMGKYQANIRHSPFGRLSLMLSELEN